uniref:TIGR03936 family radical SAM-associated protein n=1 Tax=Actinoalloteichus fjordicus TaxID=1612552 RepID=UPI00384D476D
MRFAKRDRLRFTSHRDVARSVERALRRAGVPMAYSQGFNPHPKVSWAGAAPTGAASEAEYVEFALAERVDPPILGRELNAALPPGLDIVDVVEAGPGSLAERLTASSWRIEVPGVDPEVLRDATRRMLAEEVVEVERLTKNGLRTIDARAAIVRAEVYSSAAMWSDTACAAWSDTATSAVAADGGSAAVAAATVSLDTVSSDAASSTGLTVAAFSSTSVAADAAPVQGGDLPIVDGGHATATRSWNGIVADPSRPLPTDGPAETATHRDAVVARRAGTADRRSVERPYGILVVVVRQVTPTVRPDDVLSALRVVAAVEPPVPAKATRMAQGRLDDDGRLVDPLTADRAVARD